MFSFNFICLDLGAFIETKSIFIVCFLLHYSTIFLLLSHSHIQFLSFYLSVSANPKFIPFADYFNLLSVIYFNSCFGYCLLYFSIKWEHILRFFLLLMVISSFLRSPISFNIQWTVSSLTLWCELDLLILFWDVFFSILQWWYQWYLMINILVVIIFLSCNN
jgi:hypothetical protein